MRLKTFVTTYILFLCILFLSVGIVSVYLSNSQISMLEEKSVGQFRTISASLGREIAGLYGRFGADDENLPLAIDNVVLGYVTYYRRHNVHLSLSTHDDYIPGAMLSYDDDFIRIRGSLPYPLERYRLDYSLDISENISDMQNIQNFLLLSTATFSVIAAIALHYLLSFIFTEKLESQIMLLEKELEGKQQFVDNFAHEIRTPLTSIYGYAEYLQKVQLDEHEIIESTGYIMSESTHMKKLANSLLELSTLRHYVPVRSRILIQELFDDVKSSLSNLLLEHDIELNCRISTNYMTGQEDLIKSLLINLVSNAVKAGSSEITLEAKKQSGNIIISVIDNGCGIPEDSLSKIMEPFYRVDKSRSRDLGGVGIGLTLCKQIAQVHGAKLIIESTENIGTAVTIIFTT